MRIFSYPFNNHLIGHNFVSFILRYIKIVCIDEERKATLIFFINLVLLYINLKELPRPMSGMSLGNENFMFCFYYHQWIWKMMISGDGCASSCSFAFSIGLCWFDCPYNLPPGFCGSVMISLTIDYKIIVNICKESFLILKMNNSCMII